MKKTFFKCVSSFLIVIFSLTTVTNGADLSGPSKVSSESPAFLNPSLLLQESFPEQGTEDFGRTPLADLKFLSVAGYAAAHCFKKEKSVETLPKTMRDLFQHDLDLISEFNFEKSTFTNGVLEVPYRDAGGEFKLRLSRKSDFKGATASDSVWGIFDDFAIELLPVYPAPDDPAHGRDRDIREARSLESNPVIDELIKDGKVLELNLSDKNGLVAFWVKPQQNYSPGTGFDVSTLKNDEKIDPSLVLDKTHRDALVAWLKDHKIGDQYVRFRVVPGMAILRKGEAPEGSNISHAGFKDKTIYMGFELLRYLLSDGDENKKYREEILDEDEFKHLTDENFTHADTEEEQARIVGIARLAEGLSVKGTDLRMVLGYKNTDGLPMVQNPVLKAFVKADEGYVDVGILELDPASVDVELSIADDIDFLPNRFNRWDGIVRDKLVARVNVPRSGFATKPVREVVRQSIVIPSDDIGDSYPEMRNVAYVPHKSDHLENAGFDISDVRPNDGFVGYVGNGNLLMNPNIVAWKDGVFYKLDRDKITGRAYPCLVRFKSGEMAIKKLMFVETGETARVIDAETNSDITETLKFASSGIGIMHNGKDSPLVRYFKGEDKDASRRPGEAFNDAALWQDYDIRHYLSLPFLGVVGGTFGMDQFYADDGSPNVDLIEQALRGDAVAMSYDDSYKTALIDVLRRIGYKAVDDKTPPSSVGPLQYLMDPKSHTIYLRFEASLYAHNICVEAEDGKILFVVPKGASSTKGVTFREIGTMLAGMGIKAKNVLVFDNGGDAMLNYRGMEVVPSFNSRDRIMSMFLFREKGWVDRKPVQDAASKPKSLTERAVKAVKTLRSMYRYITDRREKDPSVIYSRSERFIVENAQFLSSQIEYTLDQIELYIKMEDPDKKIARNDPAKTRARVLELLDVLGAEAPSTGIFRNGKFLKGADPEDVNQYLIDSIDQGFFLEAVTENNARLGLTEEEIKVLPEIWRLKALMALARFFEDAGDTGREPWDKSWFDRRIGKLDGVTHVLLGAMVNYRSIDKMARYGGMEKYVKKSLNIGIHAAAGAVPGNGPVPDRKAETILNACRENLKNKNLTRGSSINHVVNFATERSRADLSEMVSDALRFEDLDKSVKDLWKRQTSPDLYNFFTNGWINVLSSEMIIFSSDKVVAYLAKDGSIMLAVSGDESAPIAAANVKDISIIKVLLDADNRVSMVAMESPADPGKKALSRTTLAIQLTDSGILDRYPELLEALKGNLVWQDVSPESRERDTIDRREIDRDLLTKAGGEDALALEHEEIAELLDMRYCKTMVIRRLALEAFMSLYDKGHPFFINEDGGFDEEKMKTIATDFILEDIEEDFRVIERAIKSDRSFVRDIYAKLFARNVPSAAASQAEAFKDVQVEEVKLEFVKSVGPRQLYKASFTFDHKGEKEFGECCIELLRHDTLTSDKRSEDEIRGSVFKWASLIRSKVEKGMARFGASSWEIDYRSKVMRKQGTAEAWVNNIHIEARQFVDGPTLAELIKDPSMSGAEKREAVRACVKTAVDLYKESKKMTGVGHFIKAPSPEDFVLVRSGRSAGWEAVTVNMTKLEEYHSFRDLVMSFSPKMWGSIKDVDFEEISNEVFMTYGESDMNAKVREFLSEGKMVEIYYDESARKLAASRLKLSPGYTPAGEVKEIEFADMVDPAKYFTSEQLGEIEKWMKAHRTKRGGKNAGVRFRIAEKDIMLGWASAEEHAQVAAYGNSEGCIYMGGTLLGILMSGNSAELRKFILDEDLMKHVAEKDPEFRPEKGDAVFAEKLRKVGELNARYQEKGKGKERSREEENELRDKINDVAASEAAGLAADTDTLVFDIDETLNTGRGKQITPELARLLFDFAANRGKKIRIISGRSIREIEEGNVLGPLVEMLQNHSKKVDMVIYASEGAGKYSMNPDGTFTPDEGYNRPFSRHEADIINRILETKHAGMEREQELSRRGIDKYIVNEAGIKFAYSPYGKLFADEYLFEKDLSKNDEYPVERKTRRVIADEIEAELKENGITDVEVIVSGKTTISIIRKGANKGQAIEDVIKFDGKAIYFGDETTRKKSSDGSIVIGNDFDIAVKAEGNSMLYVVSLNKHVEPDTSKIMIPAGVIRVGGHNLGTERVLTGALAIMQMRDPVERQASEDMKKMFAMSLAAEGDEVEVVCPVHEGAGIGPRRPLYVVETRLGKSYRFRQMDEKIFGDPLEAARYEVWTLGEIATNPQTGMPMPFIAKTDKEVWEKVPEDRFIYTPEPESGRFYLLYEDATSVEDTGSSRGKDAFLRGERGLSSVGTLAAVHRSFLTQQEGASSVRKDMRHPRKYKSEGPEALSRRAIELNRMAGRIKSDPGHSEGKVMSRAQMFITENAEFILDQADKLRKSLRDELVNPTNVRRVPIAGDFHPGNVLFVNDKVTGLADWSRSRVDVMIMDLVTMLTEGDLSSGIDMELIKDIFVEYNKMNPLNVHEAKAIPELFRYRLLESILWMSDPSSLVDPQQYGLDPNDSSTWAVTLLDNFGWIYERQRDIVGALKDLDRQIESGVFEREIVADLIPAGSVQQPRGEPALDSGVIYADCIRDLGESQKGKTVDIRLRLLSSFRIEGLLAKGEKVAALNRKTPGKWKKEGYYYSNGWHRFLGTDEIIGEKDSAVIYRTGNGAINIVIRGRDDVRVAQGMDRAMIEIKLDGNGNVSEIAQKHIGDYDLSRSSIALILTDSGVFKEYPGLEKALKYQIVWEGVGPKLRYREIRDTDKIDMALLERVANRPQDASEGDIREVEAHVYIKSRTVRKMALKAMLALYDEGVIRGSELRGITMAFLENDIEEDRRVIERMLKNNRAFLEGMFGEDLIRRIDGVTIEYAWQDDEKTVYKARHTPGDGETPMGPDNEVTLTVVREDVFSQGMDRASIDDSVETWQKVSEEMYPDDALSVKGIPRYLAHAWEVEYRPKKARVKTGLLSEKEIMIENNILVTAARTGDAAREPEGYSEGAKTLREIFMDRNIAEDEKEKAKEACRKCMEEVFNAGVAAAGKGSCVEYPSVDKFMVVRIGNDAASGEPRYAAQMADMVRFVDYPNIKMALDEFNVSLQAFEASLRGPAGSGQAKKPAKRGRPQKGGGKGGSTDVPESRTRNASLVNIEEARKALNDRNSAICRELATVYGEDQLDLQRKRYLSLLDKFLESYPGAKEVCIARAGGRVTIAGGMLDYNHGPVMNSAVRNDIVTVVAVDQDRTRKKVVLVNMGPGFPPQSVGSVDEITVGAKLKANLLWSDYCFATLAQLNKDILAPKGEDVPGLHVLMDGRAEMGGMPTGIGLSSSAATEVSFMRAVIGALGLEDEVSLAEITNVSLNTEQALGFICGIQDPWGSLMGASGDDLLEDKNYFQITDCTPRTDDNDRPYFKSQLMTVPDGYSLYILRASSQKKTGEGRNSHNTGVFACDLGAMMLRNKMAAWIKENCAEKLDEFMAGLAGRCKGAHLSPGYLGETYGINIDLADINRMIEELPDGKTVREILPILSSFGLTEEEVKELYDQCKLIEDAWNGQVPLRIRGLVRHVVNESERARAGAKALEDGDMKKFFAIQEETGASVISDVGVNNPLAVAAITALKANGYVRSARILVPGSGANVAVWIDKGHEKELEDAAIDFFEEHEEEFPAPDKHEYILPFRQGKGASTMFADNGARMEEKKRKLTADKIHAINSSMPAEIDKKKTVVYLLQDDLVPAGISGRFIEEMKSLDKNYPYMREHYRVITKEQAKDMGAYISSLKAGMEEGQEICINAALTDEDLMKTLPAGVKALVFRGANKEDGFRQIEGVVAALRALQREDAGILAELYRLLTGKTLPPSADTDILASINNPEMLAKIIIFDLPRMDSIPVENLNRLNDLVLGYLVSA